ncbi:MAG TPA: type II secretion system F family protein [Gemmatimonadales bacterium]|nr:type II secretion system F family protein [Gemmatimonadales bacterium]
MSASGTRYRYRAVRSDGRAVTGFVEARNAADATAQLVARDLHPLACDVAAVPMRAPGAARRRDLAVLFQSLAALTGAGVPLDRALGASVDLTRGRLRHAVTEARRHVREGRSLSQAFEVSEGLLPHVVIGMLRAGERGGRLPAALGAVARHLEQEAELIARVRQALAYPTLIAIAGLVSTVAIGMVVIPRFAGILGDMGTQLPPATRWLLGVSRLLSRYGVFAVFGAGIAGIAGVEWARRPTGRLVMHRCLLALPGVGTLRLALASARVCRALAGMLEAGMPLLRALDAARDAAGDVAIAERLDRARESIAQGQSFASSVTAADAFLPAALQLLAVGESSGHLAEMANRAGDLAATEAERSLKTVTALLEPGLIVVFGGLVAFVAAALLQAVYSLRPGVL